jgi:hypothetical protein
MIVSSTMRARPARGLTPALNRDQRIHEPSMQLIETTPPPNGLPAAESPTRREYRRILVAVDEQRDLALVPDAVELARSHRAILEIVCGSPRLNPFAYSTMAAVALAHEGLEQWQKQLLDSALRT